MQQLGRNNSATDHCLQHQHKHYHRRRRRRRRRRRCHHGNALMDFID